MLIIQASRGRTIKQENARQEGGTRGTKRGREEEARSSALPSRPYKVTRHGSGKEIVDLVDDSDESVVEVLSSRPSKATKKYPSNYKPPTVKDEVLDETD